MVASLIEAKGVSLLDKTWLIKSMVQSKSMVDQNRKYGRVCDSAERCVAIGKYSNRW